MVNIRSAIYSITNTHNNKIYVGSAVNYLSRWTNHKSDLNRQTHCNKKLQNAWNKYGESIFEFSIIELVPDLNLLIEREQYWIDFHNSFRKGYNMTMRAGSSLGLKRSNETKERIRVAFSTPERKLFSSNLHKGKFVSDETRNKQSIAKQGKIFSQETKDKQSKAITEWWRKRKGLLCQE